MGTVSSTCAVVDEDVSIRNRNDMEGKPDEEWNPLIHTDDPQPNHSINGKPTSEMKTLFTKVVTLEQENEKLRLRLSESTGDLERRNIDLSALRSRGGSDDEFCVRSNAFRWNEEEVWYWLMRIHCDMYIDGFAKHRIDGNMLCHDITKDVLIETIGVAELHIPKLMREIEQLSNQLEFSAPQSITIAKDTKFHDEISSLRSEVSAKAQETTRLKGELKKALVDKRFMKKQLDSYTSPEQMIEIERASAESRNVLRQEKEELHRIIDEMQKKLNETEKELETVGERHQKQLMDLQFELAKLTLEKEETQSLVTELRGRNDDLVLEAQSSRVRSRSRKGSNAKSPPPLSPRSRSPQPFFPGMGFQL